MKANVTIYDIREIESELNTALTDEQRDTILKEYNRVVTDKADDWYDIIKGLIKENDNKNSTTNGIDNNTI